MEKTHRQRLHGLMVRPTVSNTGGCGFESHYELIVFAFSHGPTLPLTMSCSHLSSHTHTESIMLTHLKLELVFIIHVIGTLTLIVSSSQCFIHSHSVTLIHILTILHSHSQYFLINLCEYVCTINTYCTCMRYSIPLHDLRTWLLQHYIYLQILQYVQELIHNSM